MLVKEIENLALNEVVVVVQVFDNNDFLSLILLIMMMLILEKIVESESVDMWLL